jgi:hypothetical protein
MDREGCKYDIILKDYNTIKEFNKIRSEYYAKNTKIFINKLFEKLNKDSEYKFIRVKAIKSRINILHKKEII